MQSMMDNTNYQQEERVPSIDSSRSNFCFCCNTVDLPSRRNHMTLPPPRSQRQRSEGLARAGHFEPSLFVISHDRPPPRLLSPLPQWLQGRSLLWRVVLATLLAIALLPTSLLANSQGYLLRQQQMSMGVNPSVLRRQYWLLCPSQNGNATINVQCGTQPKNTSGPIVRIIDMRAHLISDNRAWLGLQKSCNWSRELSMPGDEIGIRMAELSLGSIPLPVHPDDAVTDLLLKNCQGQPRCFSNDSKNINSLHFTHTFKSIEEAQRVFHESQTKLKLPVVLELGYLCPSTQVSPPRGLAANPQEMCSAKSAPGTQTKTELPYDQSTTGVTTSWLWSPSYPDEDTPSTVSCRCVIRAPRQVNVTIVAHHVRSYNSKTSGNRNIYNKRIITMVDDSCRGNDNRDIKNEPCVPAICTRGKNGQVEIRLGTECQPGVSPSGELVDSPIMRDYAMRRVWLAVETSSYSTDRLLLLQKRRRRRHSAIKGKRRRRAAAPDPTEDDIDGTDYEGEENVEEGEDNAEGGDEAAAPEENAEGGGDDVAEDYAPAEQPTQPSNNFVGGAPQQDAPPPQAPPDDEENLEEDVGEGTDTDTGIDDNGEPMDEEIQPSIDDQPQEQEQDYPDQGDSSEGKVMMICTNDVRIEKASRTQAASTVRWTSLSSYVTFVVLVYVLSLPSVYYQHQL